MGPETKSARVIRNRLLALDVHELAIEPLLEGGEPFRSGQYALLRAPGATTRPFSIASSPNRPDRLEFCFRRVGDRSVSAHLAALRPGDTVEYLGPLGAFALREHDRRRLFVATGTGISPLRSMIHDLLERSDPTPLVLVFGNRSSEDAFYLEEFRELARRHAWVRFVPCLSRPGRAGWKGDVGRVTDVLPNVIDDGRSWSAYVCGRPEMVADATRILIGLGLAPERCYREP